MFCLRSVKTLRCQGCGSKRAFKRGLTQIVLSSPPASVPGLRGPTGEEEWKKLGGYYRKHEALIELRKQFGDLVALDIPSIKSVVAFDPEDIRSVYSSEGKYPFGSAQLLAYSFESVRKDIFPNSPTSFAALHGEEWKKLRTTIQKDITPPAVAQSYLPLLNNTIPSLIEKLPDFPIEHTFAICSLEMFHMVMYGFKMGFTDMPIESNSWYPWMISGKEIFPLMMEYQNTPEDKKEPIKQRLLKLWGGVIKPQIESYMKTLSELKEWENKPVKPYVIRFTERNAMTTEEALNQVGNLLLAAIDTTAQALLGLTYHLSVSPEYQEKLYKEVSSVTKGGPLLEEHMKSIPYLRACLKENYRLMPGGASNGRVLDKEITLKGHVISPGTLIELSGIPYCYDESIFPKASYYIPDRWIGEKSDSIANHPYLILPFSIGGRICLGSRVAESELMAFAAALVQKYKVSKASPSGLCDIVCPFAMSLEPLPTFEFTPRK